MGWQGSLREVTQPSLAVFCGHKDNSPDGVIVGGNPQLRHTKTYTPLLYVHAPNHVIVRRSSSCDSSKGEAPAFRWPGSCVFSPWLFMVCSKSFLSRQLSRQKSFALQAVLSSNPTDSLPLQVSRATGARGSLVHEEDLMWFKSFVNISL